MSWNITVENEEVVIALSVEDAAVSMALAAAAAAEASKLAAQQAETNAETAQGLAETAATASQTAQQLAEDAADTATAQAVIATSQAEIATTQASNAQSSANAASATATNALNSANAASASATNAQSSANAASASATNAQSSANAASVSATNALNSANAAAASAASAAQVGTSTLLTGFSAGSNTAIVATDSILNAFNKTQGQLNARAVISGTPVAGQVAFWGSASAVAGSSNFIWDNAGQNLNLNGVLRWGQNAISGNNRGQLSWDTDLVFINAVQNLGFRTNGSDRMRVFVGGNVGINTTTDAGFRLDVNGTARVSGALTTNLTAGRVPFIGTSGVLSDDSGMTWNNTLKTLTLTTTSGTIRPLNLNFLNGTSFIGNNVGEFVFNVLQVTSTAGSASFQPRNNGTASGSFVTYSTLEGGNLFGIARANLTALIQSGGSGLMVGVTTAHPLIFGTNDLERARIDSNGSFLIGTSSTLASSVLTIESTTRGVLFPRMTSAQRNAISSPATGLVVYNTTDNRLSVFNGTAWVNISTL